MPIRPNGGRQGASDASLVRTVGTGTGDLLVDGNALGIEPGDVVEITPGKYSSITLENLSGQLFKPVRVVASGLVEVVGGGMYLHNVSHLTVDGGTKAKNLFLHDIPYRGISISGSVPHGLTLQGIRARNIGDYTIFYGNQTTYDNTDATAFINFKLLFCDFENAGTIQFNGNLLEASGLVNSGFVKNAEVAFCSFRNSPTTGILMFFGNVENLNVHHNWINNVNTQNNDHNGLFFLRGNGAVHHNKCTNHQGNFVRFRPFSQGNTPKEVLLHNNIVWNSRKYSALEVQSFAENMVPGVSTYCNAKVYNNTVGRMNTTRPTDFVGVVVDVYNLFGGDLQIFNNLSFEQVKSDRNDGIWSQQSVTVPSLNSNNRMFPTLAAAGLVDQNFFRLQSTSLAKGTGLNQSYLTDDFYGTQRTTTPSVGAVE
ncbi:MAG: hypothetical protein H7Z72_24505 [Bacteroidetes bacterium]|nr:hypothetical protein [Fibrella sp.]